MLYKVSGNVQWKKLRARMKLIPFKSLKGTRSPPRPGHKIKNLVLRVYKTHFVRFDIYSCKAVNLFNRSTPAQ